METLRLRLQAWSTALGIDPEIAEDEACRMEHAISDDSFEKWVAYIEGLGLVSD